MNKDCKHLISLGWNEYLAEQINSLKEIDLNENHYIARITSIDHGVITLYDSDKYYSARVKGRLLNEINQSHNKSIAVGDWVVFHEMHGSIIIDVILDPFSALYRSGAGNTSARQVISANIDTIFIVTGLDNDFNLRRIERYLTISYESKAKPVILLNKCDLCHPDDMIPIMNQVQDLAKDVPVYMISALYSTGLDELKVYLKSPFTVTVVGSSGSGKSSLVNRFLGKDLQKTADVRVSDSRGKHTTVTRSLFMLPVGGVLIDNPGMREIQLDAGVDSVDKTFTEIAELVKECRFSNCSHTTEPGCAVQKALLEGRISSERWAAYLKQISEVGINKERKLVQKKIREKEISKLQKSLYKNKNFFKK